MPWGLYLSDIGRDVTPTQPQMPRTHSSSVLGMMLTRWMIGKTSNISNRSKNKSLVTVPSLLSKITRRPLQNRVKIGTSKGR